jgi:Mn2+/Fe2+ NRAMP family transporter
MQDTNLIQRWSKRKLLQITFTPLHRKERCVPFHLRLVPYGYRDRACWINFTWTVCYGFIMSCPIICRLKKVLMCSILLKSVCLLFCVWTVINWTWSKQMKLAWGPSKNSSGDIHDIKLSSGDIHDTKLHKNIKTYLSRCSSAFSFQLSEFISFIGRMGVL